MKRTTLYMLLLLISVSAVFAQVSALTDTEPEKSELGAPLYPGALFIRTLTGLDPYFQSVMYVTLDPLSVVEEYLELKMPEKRKVWYDADESLYMTVFLLKTFSVFPGTPTHDDLSKLEHEPNIQIFEYDPDSYEPLAEYFSRYPETKIKAEALRKGKSFIIYTYPKTETYRSSERIIGTWTSSDRDLEMYFKSIFTFNSDNTYTLQLTDKNVDEYVKQLSAGKFKDRSEDEIRAWIDERNPEQGTYVIMRNTITVKSENPLIDPETKGGKARVYRTLMSIEFFGKPKLSYIRTSK